jgi:hypothetical protein
MAAAGQAKQQKIQALLLHALSSSSLSSFSPLIA